MIIKLLAFGNGKIKDLKKGLEIFNEDDNIKIINFDDGNIIISGYDRLKEITNKKDSEIFEEVINMSLRPEQYDNKVFIESFSKFNEDDERLFRVDCVMKFEETDTIIYYVYEENEEV